MLTGGQNCVSGWDMRWNLGEKGNDRAFAQQITQQPPLSSSSFSTGILPPLLFLRACRGSAASEGAVPGTPSLMSILARVAVSKTSSTPSISKAEHSLYARAPMSWATRSPCSRVTHGQGLSGVLGCGVFGRRSALQPTRMTGITDPQMDRTSSIHWKPKSVSNSTETIGINYLCRNILQGIGSVKSKGDENYVRFWVRHGSQALFTQVKLKIITTALHGEVVKASILHILLDHCA